MTDTPPPNLNDPSIPTIGAPKITPIQPADLQKLYDLFGLDLKEFGVPLPMEKNAWLFLIPLIHALAIGTHSLRGALDGCIDYLRENLPPRDGALPGEHPLIDHGEGGGEEVN